MTVALAFKAFAKAIPCLTPFLATSDPSVLRRILAYIRASLARRAFSLECHPYLYGPIVAARLRANLEAGKDVGIGVTGTCGSGEEKGRIAQALLSLLV